MDKLYSFKKEIIYILPTYKNGIIEFFEEDARNGNNINKVIIQVVFENYN